MTLPRLVSILTLAGLAATAAAQTCGEWVIHDGPNYDDGVHHLLRGVKAFAPDDAWAVGEYDQVVLGVHELHPIVQHFDGEQWTLVPTPLPGKNFPGGVQIYLYDVDGAAPDDIWAVGTHEHPIDPGTETLTMHWDGSAWSVVPSPKTGELSSGSSFEAVEAVAADDVWAVGLWANENDPARRSPLAAHWDGSGWTIVDVALATNGDQELRDVDADPSGSAVWVAGGFGVTETAPYVLRWNGGEFVFVEPQPDVNVYQSIEEIEVFAEDDVWVTAYRTSTFEAVMLHWDGSGWTEFDPAGAGWSLAGVAPDDIWSVDSDAISHWDGTSWTQVDSWEGNADDARVFAASDASDTCSVFAAGLHYVEGQYSTMQGWFERGCVADFNGDGSVDTRDVLAFLNAWNAGDSGSDINGDGVVDTRDVLAFLNLWNAGC
ncbi:MAG TPA: GC-type dockerin domain-anchored protein [Phycisphaerales bacterium]|nr:GC-type dockerin domain-anchored protein [Phycisphaerales bacterium]